ncbi:MAG: EAL domain-containing protein [Sideroxydans sp.]|jgi:diguanylate cyclase (GGDEF)-like protein/PAS domain S-box-containing protein
MHFYAENHLAEILVLYGLAFIVLGAVVFVLPRQDSAAPFVRHLPLLAAFGLIHGVLEFTILWETMHQSGGNMLEWVTALILFASFLPLFEFGRRSIAADMNAPFGLPEGQATPWLYAILILAILAVAQMANNPLLGFVTATRFFLGFPAALLAGFALWGRTGLLFSFQSYSRIAAVGFFIYAISTIVMNTNDANLPLSFMTQAQFRDVFGMPVQTLRAVCASVVALGIVQFVRHMNDEARSREMAQVAKIVQVNAKLQHQIEENEVYERELSILATAFEMQDGLLITDAQGKIVRVNEGFLRITGYTAEEVMGRNPRMLSAGMQDAEFYKAMWQGVLENGTWAGEVWNRRKSGEIYPEHLAITAVKGGQFFVGAFSDISKQKLAEEEVRQLALYDPLTKLPNRRLLRDRLALAFKASARSKKHGALMFIDLDNFKNINDTKGHELGDLLLQQVADRLTNSVRESDTVARVGGDEFVLILVDLDEHAEAAAAQVERVTDKILKSLRQTYDLDGYEYHCSASIGASLFFDHEMGIDELFRRADTAMYRAKATGKNAFCFFDPEMQSTLEARLLLENDLRDAIDNGQLQLYLQPQMDASRSIYGAEALLRWRHPRRGMVGPAEFIPLAEESGLILQVGEWVLSQACAQLKRWESNTRTRHLKLAVNVSALQFRQPDFVAQVERLIRQSGIDAALLKLELTESALLDDIEVCIQKMAELRMMGVGFSLDDFGTGFSSLTYLKRLPITQLKIDQSFVRDIASDSNDAAIVQTIIAMAAKLDLDVIAEGVETEGQLSFLERSGCCLFQGYLLGRPMPITEFEQLPLARSGV